MIFSWQACACLYPNRHATEESGYVISFNLPLAVMRSIPNYEDCKVACHEDLLTPLKHGAQTPRGEFPVVIA